MGISAYDVVGISNDGTIYKLVVVRVLLYKTEAIVRI